MAIPAPSADPGIQAARGFARQISQHLAPRTRAYHEIWLDGEKLDQPKDPEAVEPLYRDVYLPRKFKIAIGLPDDNSVDVYANDVGLIAIVEGGVLRGVNVVVGGGLGMTHGKENTYARLATPLGYVDSEHVIETCRIIATMHRDYGDRSDRRNARLKFGVCLHGLRCPER